MPLLPGTRLGPYVTAGPIGAGGMGEVYRARDTKLEREVAVKILPDAFASDPERLSRFEREARTLAALNHPNIAAIYGLEESASVRALVMELVDGPTLEEVIHGSGPSAREPLDLEQALGIALQVATALEAAHEIGIVHRDLKPANIKVRSDGTVKVLDFGLAKALQPQVEGSGQGTDNLANSPTMTSPAMTAMGIILGTAAYMAPEQAKARPVDRRTDIWAFGCVLYEMLSGRGAFEGETVTDVLAAVIMKEPDWPAMPQTTPPAIQRLVRRCLQKNVRHRLQAIGEARIAIENALAGEDAPDADLAPGAARGGGSILLRLLPWTLVGALTVALSVVAGIWKFSASAVQPFPMVAYVPPPANTTFRDFGFGAGPVAVSPDAGNSRSRLRTRAA